MLQQLRVDTAGLELMARRWGASVAELNATTVPASLGLWCQASATAVNAAHAEIKAFTESLAAQVANRASQVLDADTRYIANEATSENRLGALTDPVTRVQ